MAAKLAVVRVYCPISGKGTWFAEWPQEQDAAPDTYDVCDPDGNITATRTGAGMTGQEIVDMLKQQFPGAVRAEALKAIRTASTGKRRP